MKRFTVKFDVVSGSPVVHRVIAENADDALKRGCVKIAEKSWLSGLLPATAEYCSGWIDGNVRVFADRQFPINGGEVETLDEEIMVCSSITVNAGW